MNHCHWGSIYQMLNIKPIVGFEPRVLPHIDALPISTGESGISPGEVRAPHYTLPAGNFKSSPYNYNYPDSVITEHSQGWLSTMHCTESWSRNQCHREVVIGVEH